jgi:5-bromo-4-chloroindolyl phosphate hydrolysis protein
MHAAGLFPANGFPCMSDNANEANERLTFTKLTTGVTEARDRLQRPDLTLDEIRVIKGKVEDLLDVSSSSELFSALTPDNRHQLLSIVKGLREVRAKVSKRHDEFLRINFFFFETLDNLVERLRELDARLDYLSPVMNDSIPSEIRPSPWPALQSISIKTVSNSLTAVYKDALKAARSEAKSLHTFPVEIIDPGAFNFRLTGNEIRSLLDPIITPIYTGALKGVIDDFVELYDKVHTRLTAARQTLAQAQQTQRRRPLREFAVPSVTTGEVGRQALRLRRNR